MKKLKVNLVTGTIGNLYDFRMVFSSMSNSIIWDTYPNKVSLTRLQSVRYDLILLRQKFNKL